MAGSGRRKRLGVLALAVVAVMGVGAVVVMRPGPLATATRTVTGSERPAGGITRERAIEIASGISAGQKPADFRASAEAKFDPAYARWTWHVSWGIYASPTGSNGCDMVVDLLTGEILHRQCWIS